MQSNSKRSDPFQSTKEISFKYEKIDKNLKKKASRNRKFRQTIISNTKVKVKDKVESVEVFSVSRTELNDFQDLIINGIKIKFPFVPYQCQLQVMSKLL